MHTQPSCSSNLSLVVIHQSRHNPDPNTNAGGNPNTNAGGNPHTGGKCELQLPAPRELGEMFEAI